MSDEEIKPNLMPKMTSQEVRDRAEKIFHRRGPAPYTVETFHHIIEEEEVAVISEFVWYWQPFFVQKKRDA